MKFTHKGWLMFCPIKVGDLESEAPALAPRWAILEPVFSLAEWVQSVVILVCSAIIPGYEPLWYFKITGELPGRDRGEP